MQKLFVKLTLKQSHMTQMLIKKIKEVQNHHLHLSGSYRYTSYTKTVLIGSKLVRDTV